jgi:hypothetical protein
VRYPHKKVPQAAFFFGGYHFTNIVRDAARLHTFDTR